MRTELWNGHPIRFVERDGEWWTIAKDVCDALGHTNVTVAMTMLEYDEQCVLTTAQLGKLETKKSLVSSSHGGARRLQFINEHGIYTLIFRSNKPEAKAFRKWVTSLLKSLREALGYEQYRTMAFVESARNHYLNMDVIKEALNPQDKVPYIKAQSIANKCMANIQGEPKTIDKDELKTRYPELLPLRDEILTETAKLMAMSEKYGLGLSVSETIYGKFGTAALMRASA